VAEQTVEDVRNVEDGTSARSVGAPGNQWTAPADVAMREKEPHGRRSSVSDGREVVRVRRAGRRSQNSEGGGKLEGG